MDKEFATNHQFLLAEVVTKKTLPFLIALEIRTITISNFKMLFSLFFMYVCVYMHIFPIIFNMHSHMCMCSQAQENKIQKGWEFRQEFTEKKSEITYIPW